MKAADCPTSQSEVYLQIAWATAPPRRVRFSFRAMVGSHHSRQCLEPIVDIFLAWSLAMP
jgi:hypothetical protein